MEFSDVIGNESDDSGTNSSWNSDTDCEIDEQGENLSEEDELYSENENEDEEIGQFHEIDNEVPLRKIAIMIENFAGMSQNKNRMKVAFWTLLVGKQSYDDKETDETEVLNLLGVTMPKNIQIHVPKTIKNKGCGTRKRMIGASEKRSVSRAKKGCAQGVINMLDTIGELAKNGLHGTKPKKTMNSDYWVTT
ncbi:hypothetical protein L1887_06719 [Cichorium endivia]|nr:hypothetical protein L1887_06719 [Cichorium endivia]